MSNNHSQSNDYYKTVTSTEEAANAMETSLYEPWCPHGEENGPVFIQNHDIVMIDRPYDPWDEYLTQARRRHYLRLIELGYGNEVLTEAGQEGPVLQLELDVPHLQPEPEVPELEPESDVPELSPEQEHPELGPEQEDPELEPEQDDPELEEEPDESDLLLLDPPSSELEDVQGEENEKMNEEDNELGNQPSSEPEDVEEEAGNGEDVEMDDQDGEVEDENEDGNSSHFQSDADTTHRPSEPNALPAEAKQHTNYVSTLRKRWLKEGGDPAQEVFIPDGYSYVGIPRSDESRRDMYLYSHPTHYRFRSVHGFFPHLRYLIARSNGQNDECECKGCEKVRKRT
jgi:hypothetical protein